MKCDSSRDTSDVSRNYHLIGVGGVGMSALAQLLLALGHRVSGSDRYYDQGRELEVLKKLRSLGVNLLAQDGRAVTEGLDAVIISSAIENDNPDLVAARLKEIPVVHRAGMLADLARDKKCIAVTGTAGKTTVTGMIGFCLEQAGGDPTVINGGAVLNWVDAKTPGNFRCGHSDLWVLELDESDRSLLRFFPDWAVITNISKDHFELDEVKTLFAAFAKQVKNDIIGYDPPLKYRNFEACLALARDAAGPEAHALPNGFSDQEKVGRGVPAAPSNLLGIMKPAIDFQPGVTEHGVTFQYRNVKFQLSLLGRHNAENALHCVMLCEKLGLDLNDVSRSLGKFAGIQRRLEVIGRTGGVTVIDDYAHNPAKIAAAWQAVEPLARRIIAVWRPHGYGPLALMRRELIDVFSKHVRAEDRLIIMSVYFAGGTAGKEVTAAMLADDLTQKGLPVGYCDNYEVLRSDLLKSVRAGDAVLFMGARDPDLPVFARSFFFNYDNFIMNRVSGSGGIPQED